MNTPTVLTPEQDAIVQQLCDAQETSGLGDNKFGRRYIGCSGSKWNRIKSREYFQLIQSPAKEIESLKARLGAYNAESALLSRFDDRPLVETLPVKMLRKAIADCEVKPIADPVRCIIFLAPTGGGKTFVSMHLRNEDSARTFLVEARECWKRSYFHCIRDICVAAGIDVHDTSSPSEMEQRLIARFSEERYRLVIDEGEYFGPQALNLIKLLLNKTLTVIVIACIPTAYEKWNRSSSHEAGQIRRRTHYVVRAEEVDCDVVEKLLENSQLNGEKRDAAARITRAANKFGGYDIARRICTRVIKDGAATLTAKRGSSVEASIVKVGEALGGIAL